MNGFGVGFEGVFLGFWGVGEVAFGTGDCFGGSSCSSVMIAIDGCFKAF